MLNIKKLLQLKTILNYLCFHLASRTLIICLSLTKCSDCHFGVTVCLLKCRVCCTKIFINNSWFVQSASRAEHLLTVGWRQLCRWPLNSPVVGGLWKGDNSTVPCLAPLLRYFSAPPPPLLSLSLPLSTAVLLVLLQARPTLGTAEVWAAGTSRRFGCTTTSAGVWRATTAATRVPSSSRTWARGASINTTSTVRTGGSLASTAASRLRPNGTRASTSRTSTGPSRTRAEQRERRSEQPEDDRWQDVWGGRETPPSHPLSMMWPPSNCEWPAAYALLLCHVRLRKHGTAGCHTIPGAVVKLEQGFFLSFILDSVFWLG